MLQVVSEKTQCLGVDTLQINEVFASVQGETSFTGLPTTFIRLAACNLRCTWCDTPYSFGRGNRVEIDSLLQEVAAYGCRHVCVTGGEPLLQPSVHRLLSELCDSGYTVSLETGGSLCTASVDERVHIILDIKCPGSGMESKNYWENLPRLRQKDEVKFVLLDENDYKYAVDVCNRHELTKKAGQTLFSPVHGLLDAKSLVAWILRDKLPVRLNLQTHKFIWTPETRGV